MSYPLGTSNKECNEGCAKKCETKPKPASQTISGAVASGIVDTCTAMYSMLPNVTGMPQVSGTMKCPSPSFASAASNIATVLASTCGKMQTAGAKKEGGKESATSIPISRILVDNAYALGKNVQLLLDEIAKDAAKMLPGWGTSADCNHNVKSTAFYTDLVQDPGCASFLLQQLITMAGAQALDDEVLRAIVQFSNDRSADPESVASVAAAILSYPALSTAFDCDVNPINVAAALRGALRHRNFLSVLGGLFNRENVRKSANNVSLNTLLQFLIKNSSHGDLVSVTGAMSCCVETLEKTELGRDVLLNTLDLVEGDLRLMLTKMLVSSCHEPLIRPFVAKVIHHSLQKTPEGLRHQFLVDLFPDIFDAGTIGSRFLASGTEDVIRALIHHSGRSGDQKKFRVALEALWVARRNARGLGLANFPLRVEPLYHCVSIRAAMLVTAFLHQVARLVSAGELEDIALRYVVL
ncbi:unnamed protein product, partial [Notodromas monacha]